MNEILIKRVTSCNISPILIEQLSQVLSFSEPNTYNSSFKFWERWFSNQIPGDKLTIIAQKNDSIIAVTRIWKSPYVDKWLIEGLEVVQPERGKGVGKGVGKAIVKEGIVIFKEFYQENLYANINTTNLPSIKLHQSLGFEKNSTGTLNSYGEFRNHVDEYILVK